MLKIFQAIATVKVMEGIEFAFADEELWNLANSGLDGFNLDRKLSSDRKSSSDEKPILDRKPSSTEPNLDLLFYPDLDRYNFVPMPQDTVLAHLLRPFSQSPLQAWSEDGQDWTERFFQLRSHQIVAKTDLYPAMITLDVQIIRQDCFGYLLQEIDLEESGAFSGLEIYDKILS